MIAKLQSPLEDRQLWACSKIANEDFFILEKPVNEPSEWEFVQAEGDWQAQELPTEAKGKGRDRTMY